MEYVLVKLIHILSSTLLFGTGLGSAFYKWMADRGGDIHTIAKTNKTVVIADWVFTTPTVIIQPVTGLWLLHIMEIPMSEPWVVVALLLYVVAGGCWLPVVWLQIVMRDLATEALVHKKPLNDRYFRYAKMWFWLGVPAFTAVVMVYFLMVLKPTLTL